MSALAIQTTSQEAETHISILCELLREIDLEARMMTLIKAEEFLQKEDVNQLEFIRMDLEFELTKMRKMIFMVEKAQYLLTI